MSNIPKYAQGPKYNPGALVIQGNVTVSADNVYDIGTAAGNRARNLYLSGVLSAYGVVAAVANTAATAGGAQAIQISNTTARGVYWGSGAPTVSAGQGSLYIRTDGTTTNDRLYVNTNGTTAWASVTTSS